MPENAYSGWMIAFGHTFARRWVGRRIHGPASDVLFWVRLMEERRA